MQQWENKAPWLDVTKCQETSTQSSKIQEYTVLKADILFQIALGLNLFAIQSYKLFDKEILNS